MKTTNNTILITGGGSGIGFEMAKLFSKDNKVIITGRNANKLNEAVSRLENVTALVSDINSDKDVTNLLSILNRDFPNLNVVINNAGLANYYKLTDENANAFDKASAEILTNYLSIVRLTEKLLPSLQKQESAAFVNVSSIAAFSPGILLPGYAVSKAALHSYSQVLRITLEKESASPVRVFELMPPLVNTDFSKEIGGENGLNPSEVAKALKDGLELNNYEIHVGETAEFYKLFLSSPEKALQVMNGYS
ncbi:SDR family oxidoreductase [Flavobacterium aquatile]|uniref:Short-chain dehydrogenase n=1 Tax=Flavobacterium aquatile LMG 4008 = ATCC 11947 TaxID=1453498 RepID=A0A095SQY4_9FLAO|nr:SDR family NAD(P)-dependent oxidoreductase [Flavobacterium aquatile]KGD66997.1 short-chain dehydrogenase [Flavobacterium aquatile LMG 4008 = ATCC 11947]OXA68090.1 short-chain dehydrogenase [Flavobacterium aquatile LMG 4008 = ATCC 11947]GEC80159.1 oxidoreductase [Flavobacterium aquatile]